MEQIAIRRFVDAIFPAFLHGDPAVDAKPDERANVGFLEAMYRALTQGDVETFADCFAGDAEMEIHGPECIPIVGRWTGKSAVLEAIARNFSHLMLQVPEMVSLVAQGNMVVVVGREKGIVRATGSTYDTRFVQVFTFANGRLRRFEQIFDSLPVAEAFRN